MTRHQLHRTRYSRSLRRVNSVIECNCTVQIGGRILGTHHSVLTSRVTRRFLRVLRRAAQIFPRHLRLYALKAVLSTSMLLAETRMPPPAVTCRANDSGEMAALNRGASHETDQSYL